MRILFVAQALPYPPVRGDTQRSNLLYRALGELGEVDTFCICGERGVADDVRRTLDREFRAVAYARRTRPGRRGPWKFVRFVWPWGVDRLAHNLSSRRHDYSPDPALARPLEHVLAANQYDLIVGRYVSPTALSGALDVGVPTILDVDDVDTSVYRTRLATPGIRRWEAAIVRHHLGQLERLLPDCLARARHVWVASPDDLSLVEHPSKSVLPNIPLLRHGEPSIGVAEQQAGSNRILFVGSFTHAVNRRAIERFVDRSWPIVRQAVPDAVFRIVGAGLPREMHERWSACAGVEVVGPADDLPAELAGCAFTVCPIFEGGGTKIKVLESLAHGRAVVAAAHSARGYGQHLKHQQSILIAGDELQIAKACIRLLGDEKLRRSLAAAGAAIVREHYSFASFADVVRATVHGVVGRA